MYESVDTKCAYAAPIQVRLAALAVFWMQCPALAYGGDAIVPANTGCDDGPHVDEVYPTSQAVPENILRFYVYFTRAMQRHSLTTAVHLFDDGGHEVEGAFYRGRYELLSADGKRLTVLLDPGRVKTGLDSHEQLGRAVTAGQTYTFTVDTEARDTSGCRLRERHEKQLEIVPARSHAIDPEAWAIEIPAAETRESIVVRLDRPYDHVSLYHRLRIRDRSGALVPGTIDLGDDEQSWRFTPASAWQESDHQLAINTLLEDISGNRVGRPFEVTRNDDVGNGTAIVGEATLQFRPPRAGEN